MGKTIAAAVLAAAGLLAGCAGGGAAPEEPSAAELSAALDDKFWELVQEEGLDESGMGRSQAIEIAHIICDAIREDGASLFVIGMALAESTPLNTEEAGHMTGLAAGSYCGDAAEGQLNELAD